MSLQSSASMTNHHVGLLAHVAETFHLWRERRNTRVELAHLTERELHDVGLSTADAAYEVDKHFWQA